MRVRDSQPRSGRARRNWLRSIALAAVMATTMLSGCTVLNGSSDQGGSSGNSQVEKSAITIGILKTPDDSPVELAKVDGFFASVGLNPTIKYFSQGPDMYPALANGSVDFALTNYVSFFQAVAKKTIDAKIVADAYAATPTALVVLVGPNSPIKAVADLQGKKIATQAPGNINELLVRALLQTNHLNPSSPTYRPVHFPDMAAALANGSVDAITELEPYITEAQRTDGDVVPQSFHLITDATNDMPLSGYIASASFVAKNPRTVAAFQQAMVQANAAMTKPGEAAKVLPEVTGVASNLVPMLIPNLGTYPTSLDPKRLQRVVKLMQDYGRFTQALNAQTLIVPMAS
jgi:NitT/TauT family transport system substrate-binding protein